MEYTEIEQKIKSADISQPPPQEEPERQFYFIKKMQQWMTEKERQEGRKLTCHVKTFGCQMNARDSEKILGILKIIGYEETDTEEADLVLYNTCTVRENANFKVYGRLGQLKRYKEKNPHMLTILCGCMMQEPEVISRIKKSYRNVDIIFGTHNIFKLAELLTMRLLSQEKERMIIDIWEDATEIVEDLPNARKYPFKGGVNIMFGCNNFCSYCIVPYVRGRERSREPEDIIREIQDMVQDGVVEVMLLGQNVNSYGKTLDTPISFAELLCRIEKIEGLQRIRFMTSHPKDLSDELIDVMSRSEKICRHLHLPLQSGSSRLLKSMNRHYTKESYLNLVDKIRAKNPDIALTTDIIVGFPGETEEDFADTLDIVEKVGFDSAFTFIYSKRTGTPAASMENQVPQEIVKERFDRLLASVQEHAASCADKAVGRIVDVLVEEVDEQDAAYLTGRTSQNYIVHFPGDESLLGQIVPVKLCESKGFYFMGKRE